MRNAWISSAFLLLVTVPHVARSDFGIAVVSDPQTQFCQTEFQGATTIYIVALTGLGQPGITGAEFRVAGMPESYFVSVTANPQSTVAIGDPFGDGCNIAFSECQEETFDQPYILLYTVNVFAPDEADEFVLLEVVAHDTPANPSFPCPLITSCESPAFPLHCVTTGSLGTPAGSTPSDPVPADEAMQVPTTLERIEWGLTGDSFCCTVAAGWTRVYFGTTQPPPLLCNGCTGPAYEFLDPGFLEPNTTYYWAIEHADNTDCGFRWSPIWSFTTGDIVAVEPTQWSNAKRRYR